MDEFLYKNESHAIRSEYHAAGFFEFCAKNIYGN